MIKFEYKVLKMRGNQTGQAEEALNKLGKQGFEVLDVSSHPPELVAILSRSFEEEGELEKAVIRSRKKRAKSKTDSDKVERKEKEEGTPEGEDPKGASMTSESMIPA